MADQKRVLVLGDIMVDIVFKINLYPKEGAEALASSTSQRLGGSGCSTARVLDHLGESSLLAANLGCDLFGDYALKQVADMGLETDLVCADLAFRTGFMMITISPGGQRTMFGFRDTDQPPFPAEKIERMAAPASWLHISGYSALVEKQWQSVRKLISWARALGIPVSLDPGIEPVQQVPERLLAVLPEIDFLMASNLEVMACSHSADLEAGIRVLKEHGLQNLVMKLGEHGSRIISSDLDATVPAFSGAPVADTNGAGDSFNAGFIHGQLQGMTLEESARLGNAVAFLTITSGEGISGLRSIPKIEDKFAAMLGSGRTI
jgi:ribokinase